MAWHDNLCSESSNCKHIINELFARSLRIIMESRAPLDFWTNSGSDDLVNSLPSSSSSSFPHVMQKDLWFNLVLKDYIQEIENFDVDWQHSCGLLVVDILLIHRFPSPQEVCLSTGPSLKDRFFNCCSSSEEDLSFAPKIIAERWVIQYDNIMINSREQNPGRDKHEEGKKRLGSQFGKGWGSLAGESQYCHSCSHKLLSSVYKKMSMKLNIVLRSLYATVRLLPTYKIFKVLNSSSGIHTLGLGYKIFPFVEPFSPMEDAQMQKFSFSPIEIPCGRLSVSVWYHRGLSDIQLGPSIPPSPRLIMNYVGTPIADPLKRIASGSSNQPGKEKGVAAVGHASDSSYSRGSFARRHNWSHDLNREVYLYSPPHQHYPCAVSSSHPLDITKAPSLKKDPPPLFSFSPLPSISQSMRLHLSKAGGCYESPPSTVSSASVVSHGLPTPNSHDKNCNPPQSPSSTRITELPSQCERRSSAGPDELGDPPENSNALTTIHCIQKTSLCDKKISGGFCGLSMSVKSLRRNSKSSCSSRLHQEESNELEFSCPFAVDNNYYNSDSCLTQRSVHEIWPFPTKWMIDENLKAGKLTVRKSCNVAIGELIQMLQYAAPLRQGDLCSFHQCQDSNFEMQYPKPNLSGQMKNLHPSYPRGVPNSYLGSSFLLPRTKADAMEELKSFSKMKDLLLQQEGRI